MNDVDPLDGWLGGWMDYMHSLDPRKKGCGLSQYTKKQVIEKAQDTWNTSFLHKYGVPYNHSTVHFAIPYLIMKLLLII